MCELIVTSLWKTDILTPPRQRVNSFLARARFARAHNSHQYKQTTKHIVRTPGCDVLFKYAASCGVHFISQDVELWWETADCGTAVHGHVHMELSMYLCMHMCLLPLYMQKCPTHICLLPEVLLFSETLPLTDLRDFSYFAGRGRPRWCAEQIESSSGSGRRLSVRWRRAGTVNKTVFRSTLLIPRCLSRNRWQNCTPPYSWPNYPGPLKKHTMPSASRAASHVVSLKPNKASECFVSMSSAVHAPGSVSPINVAVKVLFSRSR